MIVFRLHYLLRSASATAAPLDWVVIMSSNCSICYCYDLKYLRSTIVGLLPIEYAIFAPPPTRTSWKEAIIILFISLKKAFHVVTRHSFDNYEGVT